MHINMPKAVENGSAAIPNGALSDGLTSNLHNAISFPFGGFPSLRLPVVPIQPPE